MHQVFFVKIEVAYFLILNLMFNFFLIFLQFVKRDPRGGMMLAMVIHVPHEKTYQEIRYCGPAVFYHVGC